MYFGGNNHGCQEYSKNVYKYTQADRLDVRTIPLSGDDIVEQVPMLRSGMGMPTCTLINTCSSCCPLSALSVAIINSCVITERVHAQLTRT